MLFVNEKVFQVDAGFAQKSREIVKEESETDRFVPKISDHDFSPATLAEERFAQDLFRRRHFVGQLLVNSELFDEAQNQRRIANGRLPDFEILSHIFI
jgi:hypothetical protein